MASSVRPVPLEGYRAPKKQTSYASSHPQQQPIRQSTEDLSIFTWERAAPIFPNLDSLTFEYSIPDEYVFEFVTRHPFLTYLGLVKTVLPLSPRLLDQLIGLRNLRHLGIRVLQADEDADKVWQLCARLERLDLS